ncbi:hypothetical protein F2Q69_00047122 [Brassica cretica]|uniref:Uncharacterized protein n=1 Tax=Brassica cretica TaxID=69181 RepID=A0A8S9PVE1_BRACR|nr:hypothetical protein F2Q69_00047122 [Brassica cretica]
MDSSVVRERKKTLVRVCANAGDESYHAKSLLKLVQVWTWERFQNLWREIPKGFILMIPSGIHMLIKNLYRTGTLLEDCYYPNCVELVALPLIVATSQKRKHIWDDDYNKSLLMV